MTSRATQDISLAEKLLDAVLDGKEVIVPSGIHKCHFEAVMASRRVAYGGAYGGTEWVIFNGEKTGKLIFQQSVW